VSGVAPDVPLEAIFKGALPFLFALILLSLLLIPFPQIALFLPGMMR
jgi:C4-dicarboxylate transporter, DctM subunit